MTIAPGTTYLTAKTPGSAGNVPIAGTLLGDVGASATGMLGGLDPLSSLYLQVANLFDLAGKRAALDAVAADQVAGARGLTKVSGTLGTPAAIYDVADLACDTKGPVSLDMHLIVSAGTNNTNAFLRVNDSAFSNLDWAGLWTQSTAVGGITASWIAGMGVLYLKPGDEILLHVDVDQPASGAGDRLIRYCAKQRQAGSISLAFAGWGTLAAAAGEIDSLGVQMGGGGTVKFTGASFHTVDRRIAP